MMAEERWSVQKLDGSNWMTWKFQMRHMLLDRELWGFVEGSEVLDADASEGRQAMFKRSSQKALTAIIMAMASTQIYIVRSCETPDDAWRKLQGHFEKGTLASKLHLRKRYFRMEMTEGTMVEKHLREMKELTDRLAAIGSPIAEEDQVMTLLGSLPSSFSPLVTTLGAQLDKVTWADVEHALLDEQCRKEKFQIPGKDTALVGVQGKPHNVKKSLKCFLCGRKGHFKRDCPKQKAYGQEQGHNAKVATDNAEQDEAFHAPAGQVGTGKYHKWLIDSGASCHMTWDQSILYDYRTFDKPEPVGLGDGYPVEALGIGKVQMTMLLGNGQDITREMQHVLYVPDLTTSLFSVRAVTRKGYRVFFEDEECRIETKQGKLLGKGIVDGKLFKLDCIPSVSQTATIADDSVTDVDLWHQRLGHVSEQTLKKIAQEELMTGVKIPKSQTMSFCEGCVKGKATKLPIKPVGEIRSTRKLELVHSDVCGPLQVESFSGKRYVVTFIDDYSRCCAVFFMKHKSEVLEKFKEFEATAVGDCGSRIGTLRTDNGGEYMSAEFKVYLTSRQIRHQTTVPHTPEQNGVAERMNRTLLEKARSMAAHAGVTKQYWAEAVASAAYLRNRTPTRALPDGTTPYEKWYGRKPNANNLKVFGCIAYACIPDVQRKKLDDRAKKMRFVGYGRAVKGYRLLDEDTKKIYIRRDVTFNEIDFGHDNKIAYPSFNPEETVTYKGTGEAEKQPREPEEARPDRQRRPPVRFGIDEFVTHCAHRTCEIAEPRTMKEALSSDQANKWKAAADEEIQSLMENETWDLVKLPPGRKPVGCKWVFKVKHKESGEVERFKCRLVAKGYSQSYGIDYEETFSPVVRFNSIRTLLAWAVQHGMIIHQMDVVTAFLNGKLEEEIYMEQPEGYSKSRDLVCQLRKSIYGLKQSPRCWNKELQEYLTSIGFVQSTADPCVFIRVEGKSVTVIAVYVDDLILITAMSEDMTKLKKSLESRFKMKDMGEFHYCLGISAIQDKEKGCLWIHQKQYISRMLEKYSLMDANPVTTPADPNVKLVKNDGVSKRVDSVNYQSIVGSLLYAAVATRPDIAQSVSAVSKFNAEPTESHLTAAKRILRYLKGTIDLCLMYQKTGDTELRAYSDADWAGDHDDRHSTSGSICQLSGGAVSWLSKKQASIALSTAEAEYIALCATAQEVVWLRRLLSELGEDQEAATEVFEDNQGTIAMSKNPVNHNRTKHIDIRYHYVREAVEDGIITLTYCPTKEMVADLLTKPIPREQFQMMRAGMGLKTLTD